jgi:hypothetical protein
VDDATVSVDINITPVIIRVAEFNANANANRNSFTNIVSGAANSSTAGVNVLSMIRSVYNNDTRARRAGVRLRRAIREHVSSIVGQTLDVSGNHLPSSSFLEGSARRAANVSFEGKFVARVNIIASKIGVKKIRVEFAYARKAVLNNPIIPTVTILTMTSLRTSSPNSVDNHCTESSGVSGNGRICA